MMKTKLKLCWTCLLLLGAVFAPQPGRAVEQQGSKAAASRPLTPSLLVTLPDFVATTAGMAVDNRGNLVVACPNFSDKTKPACLVRIDKRMQITRIDLPALADTGVICPMGIAFGPDGDLYMCDNQGWTGSEKGQFKGRILRLRLRDSAISSTTVVAEGMEHPKGLRVRRQGIYVTQSVMTKARHPSGQPISALYRFPVDGKNIKVSNTLDDKNIVAMFLTENKFCPCGLDGIAFDGKGNLYVGIFGDGKLYKVVFDTSGGVKSNTVLAKTDFNYALDPKDAGFLAKATTAKMRTVSGLWADSSDNVYAADFSNNAVVKVSSKGDAIVLAQNADTDGRGGELNEPGDVVVWEDMLVISNFDILFGPDKVNTKHDLPATLSALKLK